MSQPLLSQITNITTPVTRFTDSNTVVGDVVSRVLLFATAAAGIYFMVRLLLSGFNMMSSLGDPGKVQTAQHEITNSAFGLLIIIAVFFIAQITEIILGIDII